MLARTALALLFVGASLDGGTALSQDMATLPSGEGEIRYADQVVPPGTPIRVMFLSEITSRQAVAGQRFKLRVDEPVFLNGKPVIPVGTTAWGEITSVNSNGAVGRGGKLGMRILYLDLPQGRLPLRGDSRTKGDGNTGGVLLAVVGFGLLGLLTAGDSARFKGGDVITVYVDNAIGAPPETVLAQPAKGRVVATPDGDAGTDQSSSAGGAAGLGLTDAAEVPAEPMTPTIEEPVPAH